MDPGIGIVLAPSVAVREGELPIGADDELTGQLPRIVDEGTFGAMPRGRQFHAGLRVAAEEWVGRIEQDLGGRPLQEAEGFIRRAIEVAKDGDIQSLEVAVACRAFGLALSDDDDVASGRPVVLQFFAETPRAIHPARAPEVAPEQEQHWPFTPQGGQLRRVALVIGQGGIRGGIASLWRKGRPPKARRTHCPALRPTTLGDGDQLVDICTQLAESFL